VNFIGIDLGWKMSPPREKGTGACLLSEEGVVEELTFLTHDREIIDFVESNAPAWVGIDASLVVPEKVRLRRCEMALRDRGIKVLPTNRYFYQRTYGGCRGEVLAARLIQDGFGYFDHSRRCALFEVYPHAALHILTEGKVPRYKRGRAQDRKMAMIDVLCIVREWEPSVTSIEELLCEIEGTGPEGMCGLADKLDSLVSVVSVYQHWLYSGKRTEVLGDYDEGFILLPRPR
jgi:predicted RNase H-like nuclease